MEEERKDQVRDHEFDGIQEFDNRLPRWWIGTFVLTVLFALYHWTSHFTFGAKPSTQEDFAVDLAENEKLQLAKGAGGPSDEEIRALMKDPAQLRLGSEIFKSNCMACHGAQGQGVIGPNLTDAYWIHGGRPSQMARTVSGGVPDKGMPTWKGALGDTQIRQVVAFAVSLRGTRPPNPKAPQGVLEKE
jgi:cytochrome c oxidase cbb3-type subunit 3